MLASGALEEVPASFYALFLLLLVLSGFGYRHQKLAKAREGFDEMNEYDFS
jgi:hypothetical protein